MRELATGRWLDSSDAVMRSEPVSEEATPVTASEISRFLTTPASVAVCDEVSDGSDSESGSETDEKSTPPKPTCMCVRIHISEWCLCSVPVRLGGRETGASRVTED